MRRHRRVKWFQGTIFHLENDFKSRQCLEFTADIQTQVMKHINKPEETLEPTAQSCRLPNAVRTQAYYQNAFQWCARSIISIGHF